MNFNGLDSNQSKFQGMVGRGIQQSSETNATSKQSLSIEKQSVLSAAVIHILIFIH